MTFEKEGGDNSIIINWLRGEGSNLQITASKADDFTSLSTSK